MSANHISTDAHSSPHGSGRARNLHSPKTSDTYQSLLWEDKTRPLSKFRSSYDRRIGRARRALFSGLFIAELLGFFIKPYKQFKVSSSLQHRYVGVMMLSSSNLCQFGIPALAEFQYHRSILFKRIQRYASQFGRHVAFFGIREWYSDGRVHAHIMFRGCYIPQKLLSTWWSDIHHSPYCWTNYAYGAHSHAVGYISKYFSKGAVGRSFASQDWVYRGYIKDFHEISSRYYQDMRLLIIKWHAHLSRHVRAPSPIESVASYLPNFDSG